jgi:hypothetical protein
LDALKLITGMPTWVGIARYPMSAVVDGKPVAAMQGHQHYTVDYLLLYNHPGLHVQLFLQGTNSAAELPLMRSKCDCTVYTTAANSPDEISDAAGHSQKVRRLQCSVTSLRRCARMCI